MTRDASARPPLIVLASASPRRAHILDLLGVPFVKRVADIDESALSDEDVAMTAERLARAKAQAIAPFDRLPILGADTLVACEGRILGKPCSPDAACDMLRHLAGRTHQVITGLCLVHGDNVWSGVDRTDVAFEPMSAAEIEWYVASGEPMDKAGAYHIGGQGALFIRGIDGSPSNVAGLPIGLL
ncbi:MAG: Maf family protein, partial [Vicinamibacteria bacterium]|nr:Maf family protein [Vicinamibacteria bacterium]